MLLVGPVGSQGRINLRRFQMKEKIIIVLMVAAIAIWTFVVMEIIYLRM